METRQTKETRQVVLSLIGIGAFCPMFRSPFFGSLTHGLTLTLSDLRIVYDAAIILLACAFAFISLWRSRRSVDSLWQREGIVPYLAIGIFDVLGVLGMNLGKALSFDVAAFYALCIVMLSVGFASLCIAWFRVLMGLPRDQVTMVVTGAFVVSHLFGLLDALPRDWASLLNVLYPLIALVALFALRKDYVGPASQTREALLQNAYLRRMQIFTLVLVIAELMCGALLRSRWAHGGVNYQPQMGTINSYLVSVVIGFVFLFCAWRAKTTTECTLAIGSIGLVGFVVATFLFPSLSPRTMAPFVTGLYSALMVYAMALISLWGQDGKHDAMACAALFLGIFGAAAGVTSSIIPAILGYYGVVPAEVLGPVGIAAGLVISLGMCVVLFAMVVGQRSLFLSKLREATQEQEPVEIAQITPAERHERAMELVAAEYELTERERETASLLAKGHTASHVAEELTVAVSTVKGYSKIIYRKMGIHRKDELIAIVNEAKERI